MKSADSRKISLPVIGKHYYDNPYGKRILLLDGFREEDSSAVLKYYKDCIANNAIHYTYNDKALLNLWSITRAFCSPDETPDILTAFIDCCAFYCCERDAAKASPSRVKEQFILPVISSLNPDVVFVLHQSVSMPLDLNSGVVYERLKAKRIAIGEGTEIDFIEITRPEWLTKADMALFVPALERDQAAERFIEDFHKFAPTADAEAYYSFTQFGAPSSVTFEHIRHLYDFLVSEKKIEESEENLFLLAYRITGKLFDRYSQKSNATIRWFGQENDPSFLYFIYVLANESSRFWKRTERYFDFNGKIVPPRGNCFQTDFHNRVERGKYLETDPFPTAFKKAFPSFDFTLGK